MFSLEEAMKNVKNKKVVPLIEEAISGYQMGNYRSAIVLTYTAIIMDLLDKLDELEREFRDDTARDILNKIKSKIKSKNSDSSWERELPEEISKRTNLLDAYDLEDIEYIKKQRNYSAHPSISTYGDNFISKEITRETCIDVIHKAFNVSFTRPAFLGKNILIHVIEEGKKTMDMLSLNSDLTNSFFYNYMNKHYFSKMTISTKKYLVRELFKFTFQLEYSHVDSEKINSTRNSNLHLLIYLLKKDVEKKEIQKYFHQNKFLEDIYFDEEEPSFLDNIKMGILQYKAVNLAILFAELPSLKIDMSQELDIKLNMLIEKISKDTKIPLKFLLVEKDEKKYFETIENETKSENIFNSPNLAELPEELIYPVYDYFFENNNRSLIMDFLIADFASGTSFSKANNYLISSMGTFLIKNMNEKEYHKLLVKMNCNNQYTNAIELNQFLEKMSDNFKKNFGIELIVSEDKVIYNNIYDFELSKEGDKAEQFKKILYRIYSRLEIYSDFELNKLWDSILSIFDKEYKSFDWNNLSDLYETIPDYHFIIE